MDLVKLFYLLVLIGVAVALLAQIAEAVLLLARKPAWHEQHFGHSQSAQAPSHLVPVTTVDRRTQSLDFVGRDRRAVDVDGHDAEPSVEAKRA